jgi:DnaA family protein
MRTLSSFVDALDRYTLEHKRAVTLPLLRELLNLEAAP